LVTKLAPSSANHVKVAPPGDGLVFVMTPSPPVTIHAPDAAGVDPPVDLDSLAGTGSDNGRSILGTLKILVDGQDVPAADARDIDAPALSPEDRRSVNVISGTVPDRAARPRQGRDEWPARAGLPITCCTTAGARPNLVVQGQAVSSVPTQLLRWWAQGHRDCVVIDIDGRYPWTDLIAHGGRYADAAHMSADQLREMLQARRGVSVLDFSHIPAAVRSTALSRALSVIAVHRARTGQPHWIMIDAAETVLSDPDIPPHVLDLSQRGHCLVMRSTRGLPAALTASIDIVVSNGCSAGD
jgi:hypothetical protein